MVSDLGFRLPSAMLTVYRWGTYNWLGKTLMGLFLILSNFVVM